MSRRILSILTSFLIVGIAILSISGSAFADITYVRSNGSTGTSTTLDIGTPGTDRLVVVFADHESTGTNLTGVTVDTKACTLVTIADNPTGAGNHLEMWYIDEDGLGASSGIVTIAISGGDSSWAVHAHLYTGVDQSGPTDFGIDNTSASVTTATVTGIDVPANGLVVMGSGEGQDGLTATSWTSPLVERIDGGVADPNSADMADASAIESTQQTNKTYVCTWSGTHNRAAAIVAVWNAAGAASLADHTAGQETDKFGADSPVTGEELFAFQLKNNTAGQITVSEVQFQLSSVTGIAQGDFANLEIYVDDNGDGTIDGSDTTGTVAGTGTVDAGVSSITFSTDFNISASATVNYILKGDVNNLVANDTVTIDLGGSNVTLTLDNVSGSTTGVTHTADDTLIIAEHAAGQERAKFGAKSSVSGAELFAFQLTNNSSSTVTVSQVQFQLSSVAGIVQGDFANLEMYVDDNGDGTIDGSDTTGAVGGSGAVNAGVTTITFSTSFTISASATVNYILKGDVSNLEIGDKVTIDLGAGNVALLSGSVGGSATSVTHTSGITRTYNFQGVTTSNHGANGYPIAIEHDSDVFPWTSSGQQNDSQYPSDAEYVNISADNTAQWATDDPGGDDEMAITFRFYIQEEIDTISNIEILWNGNTDGDGPSNHSIWLRKDGFDEFGGTNTWVQLGSSLSIPQDQDTDLIRNLTSDFLTYINASTGAFEFVVATSRSSEDMRTNYVQIVVTSKGDVDLTDHAAGQETDNLVGDLSVIGEELSAFQLTNNTASTSTVSQVQFQLSSVTGIMQGDFANLAIYVDADNNGTIDAGETTTVGGSGTVDVGVSTITFSTSFTISASTSVNYILTGDLSNLVVNDTLTIDLGTSNITLTSGNVGGTGATSVTQTADDTVILANHSAGQESDNLEGDLSVTGEELFAFQLTNNTASTSTVSQVQFQLSSVTGIVQGDFANLGIYVDSNNNGTIEGGETTTVGGTGTVDAGVSTITFNTNFTISASTTVNYILQGDVSNLVVNDTLTIGLGTANVTLLAGSVGGSSATSATHTVDDTVLLYNHSAGQETDKFADNTSVTGAELFAFRLRNYAGSTATVSQVQFQLSSVTGIVQGDFSNLEIYVDSNNNGTIEGGETTTVGGSGVVNAGVSTITFSTSFTISGGAWVNYILKGDVSSLVMDDTITINLGTSDITLTAGSVGGSAVASVTHAACPYAYRRPITIDNTKVSGSSDLTDFPVLISLSGDWLKTTTADPVNGRIENASGYDIIFKDSTGTTQLDHEIESYDGSASGGTLLAWVRIPTLSYNTDTVIYIHYGNSCISSSQENITGVWDSNYVAVWHFKESSGTVYDSTSNNNDATPQGTPSHVDAKIGKAYNTTNGYFSVFSFSLLFTSSSMFIECWVKYDDFNGGDDPGIFTWNDGNTDMFGLNGASNDIPRFRLSSTTLEAGTASAGTWYYFVGRYTGSNMYTYHNTSQLGSVPKTGNTNFPFGTHTIGYRSAYSSSINGIIDELRISRTDRGVDYMTTTYNNQNSPATFYNVGSDEHLIGVDLAEHAAGQEGEKFGAASSVTGAELFAFELTNNDVGQATVSEVQFQLSSVGGIEQGDFANLEIYVDDNNDGTIDAEETTTVGGSGVVNAGVSTITFSTNFNISASGTVNYILKGDVSNLSVNDTVTIDLGTGNITVALGNVGGSAPTSVTHTKGGACTYYYWRQITIDNTKVSGSSDLTNFPALINLSGDWLKTAAADPTNGRIQNANGYDIIFKDTGGTQLDHEIESYDGSASGGTLVAWVRIPTLSYDTDTVIYMYYGNPCISSSQENITGVWSSNYKGVWHLKETPKVDSYAYDSTSMDNDGTFQNMDSDDQVAGQMNGSLEFTPTQSENILQVTATTDTTTTSAGYSALDSMSITPGAGDYIVWFSGSIGNIGAANITMHVSLYVNGSQVTHTERQIFHESSLDNGSSFPIATHAYISGVGAGEAIDVRWKTTGGTATMHERTLVVKPVDSANVSQATATADYTINTGGVDALVGGMTVTPGAGDYLVYFSSSAEGDTTGAASYLNLYVNGVKVPHTERVILPESSIPGTVFPISFQALVTGVGAGETIEVLGREDSGSTYVYERTLTVEKITASNITQATSTADASTTSSTYTALASMSVTPGAGDYIVWFSCTVYNELFSGNVTENFSLFVNGTQISHAEREILHEESLDSGAAFPVALHARVTGVGAGEAIDVRWKTTGATAYTRERTLVVKKDSSNPYSYIDLDSHIADYAALAVGSISIWFKYTDTSDYKILFSASCNTDDNSDLDIMYYNPDDVFMAGIREDGTNVWNCSFPANYADGSWHNYVMTVDSSGNKHFIDGSQITGNYTYGGNASTQAFFNSVTGLNTLRFGNREDWNGNQYNFAGNLDEVRISNIALSADWIQTEYNNQNAPATFYTVENEECEYSYKRTITIQASEVSGSSDLTNFPAIISLSGDWLKTTAADPTNGHIENSSGYDIIFKDSSGTQLDHEIEDYDGSASGGTLVAWVRIPTLSYNNDTVIYMYYGNTCVSSSQENITGVWSTNYKGVWHLKEEQTGTGNIGLYEDSTSNNNNGDDYVSATGQGGQIDGGQEFDGADDYISIGDSISLDITSQGTIEAWIKSDINNPGGSGTYRGILSKSNGGSCNGDVAYGLDWEGTGNLRGVIGNASSPCDVISYSINFNITEWYHIAFTWDGTDKILYVNGSEVNNQAQTITPAANNASIYIGDAWGGTDHWDGTIDEGRILDIARSADWILTEYNNQNDPSNFYSVGNEEEVGDVTIAEHAAGQETDQFGGYGSVTGAELFAFKLTNNTASQVTVDAVQFQLSSVTGIVQGDFSSLEIYVDSDNDGTIEAGETTTVGGSGVVNAGVSTVTFSTDFNISASTTVNYILKGNVNNLKENDTVTVGLGTSNVALTSGTVGGIAPTSVTHTEDEECGYSTWRQITIDNTKVSGTSDLSNFPLLVSLSGDWLKTTTADPTNGRIRNDNGYDIIFKDTDGAQLDHEIENYDGSASGGTLVAWVRIPTLSYDTDTVIYMYYGNPCISTSQENATGVWDSNFKGVWHLSESSGNAQDSTSYGTSGGLSGTVTRESNGQIGYAYDFGANGEVDCGDPIDDHLDFGTNSFTCSAWINIDQSTATWQQLLYKGGSSATNIGYDLETNQTGTTVYGSIADGTTNVSDPETTVSFDTWTHIVAVIDRAAQRLRIYKNGVEQGTASDISGIGSLSSSESFKFPHGSGSYDMDGFLDEVRVSSVALTADWILTEYNNQNDPSTFYSVGNEECSYSYRRPVTIQASQVSGTSDLTDFPVLISLSGDWLKTTTADSVNGRIENDNGYDIIFKDTGGTQLDHEIEDYDGSASGGTLVAWVRIPTLSYDTDTVIHMYYGASCISSSQENVAGVWDTYYKGVWHLKETPTVDSYAYDSTSNDNDGTFQGSMTSGDQIAGKFSGSLDFDGSNDYISVPHHSSLDMTGDLTIEVWLKYDTWSAWDYFVGKGYDSGSDTNYAFQFWDTSGDYGFDYTDSSGSWGAGNTGNTTLISGNWYHLALTYKSSTREYSYFLNGASDGGGTGSVVMDTTSYALGIAGDGFGDTSACFDGVIEEARVSNTLRSDGWIATSYNNQTNPSNFYSVGNEEDVVNVSLAEHAAGQETNSFGSQSSVTGAELFAFKLTNSEENQVTISEVQFQLSSVTGIVQGDFANLEIYVDSDNDGTIDAGEITTVGGSGVVNAGVTTITFSTAFNISASTTVNYILKGDVNNLVQPDSVTIDLGISNVTLSSGSIGGTAPTSVTHTSSAVCDYSSWRQITIDNTKVSGTSDLTNFPLLVSLSGDWLKTTTADPTSGRITNSNGYDIIFKDTGGTQLDHEIEDYDGTNGTLIAWVRIPTLSYNADTVIYIYYGNSCISSSQENITGVWDSNYKGVWHLSEDPSGTAPQMNDSTSNNNHGTSQGTMLTEDQVDGQVDGSLDFDGGDDYIALASTIAQATGTYEFWIYPRNVSGEFNIIASSNVIKRIHIYNGSIRIETDTESEYFYFTSSSISTDVWQHVVFVRAGDIGDLYVNGSWVQQVTTTGANTLTVGNIGGTSNIDRMVNGIIDEVRISNNVRSADWIQTEYNNQNDPSSFYSVGEEGTGCSYSHRKQITIQSSQVSGTSDLSSFPVIVSLADNGLRHIDSGGHVTNSNGYDIIFRASDEITQLDHEIEEYDGTSGTLVAWVRIPILSYDTNTVIYMYYGNTCISTSQENATAVWDSDYVAVWHLNDDVTDEQATGTHVDSTTNHDSPQSGNVDIPAKIANGQDFDGNDFIAVANSSLINTMSVYTRSYSLWFKADSTAGGNQVIYEEGGGTHGLNIYIDTNILYCGFWSTNIPTDRWMNTPFTDTASWHHIGFTFNSTSGVQKMYLDGVEVDSEAETGYVGSHTGDINMARSGGGSDYHDADNDSLNYYFDGGIDEFRISNSARSAGWIITSYNNQNTPSSFYNEGSEESAGTVSLCNHAAGQETDKFTTESSVTGAELFAFKLTNTADSTVTVKKVLFPLSAVTGISQGDFSNLELYVDADNDGTIGGGETTTVGGTGTVNAGVTDITFSTDFTIPANTTVNYILKGDVSNLVGNDTVTIDLGTSNVTITAGHVGGSAPTSATHTSDAGCEYSSWRQITIDNTKVSGSSDLTNFPLLISLSGDWLKTTTADTTNGRIQNASGYDIIFKDSSGTQLDHEIEDYDGTNGTLIAWVRIPTLSYDTDTVIYIHYGNPCISSSQENATGVWDDNYVGVWHLCESNGNAEDSTSYEEDGTLSGGVTQGVSGQIGNAYEFDRDTLGTVNMGDPADGHLDFGDTDDFTIEFWLKLDYFYYYSPFLVSKRSGTSSSSQGYAALVSDDANGIAWYEVSSNGPEFGIDATTALLNTGWRHVVYTFDQDSDTISTIYVDGVDDKSSTTGTIASVGGFANNNNFRLNGKSNPTTDDMFDGRLDEVRISKFARSAGWILTEYNNQNDPSTFYSVGDEGAGCSYSHRRKITIQSSEVSGTVDLSNFPVLVNLTHNSLRHIDSGGHVTNSNGYDIVFRASDEITQLDHEIEKYDGTNGTVVTWVRIPTLSYNTDTVIYMYYGNTCISASQENATGVWDSNYVGVWHLKEDPSASPPQMKNSTGDYNHATSQGSMTTNYADGKINGSLDFNGTNDYLTVPDHSSLDITTNITISAWVYYHGKNLFQQDFAKILCKPWPTLQSPWHMYGFGLDDGVDGSQLGQLQISEGGTIYLVKSTSVVPKNTWTYLVGVFDGSNLRFYFNSVDENQTSASGVTINTNDEPVQIGNWTLSSENFWDGVIDEVRISSIARSADWIQTEYNNQSTPSSFYNDGGEETAGTVSLGNHVAGQETDKFESESSVTGAELFAFKLTNTTDSDVTVKKVQFPLSSVTGISQGDFDNLYIYVDSDNDGTIDAGETTTVGGAGEVNSGVTTMTFSDNFTIAASTAVNYILVGDVSSLFENDTVTIDLNPTDVTINAGCVGGSAPTSATHTSDALCTFAYRRPITIQASQVSGTTDLTDFPVVISLSGTWLRTSTADPTNGHVENADGYDIIFRASDGVTQLDHEIEKYDGSASGGTLVAWVRIPTLDYNDNTVIYMLYGNPCIDSSTENATGVWDTNYKTVWHLKEDPSGTAPQINDSTLNNNDGTTGGTMISGDQVDGKLNGSVDFDGTDDYATMPTTGFSASAGTVELWANIDTFPSSNKGYIFSHCTLSPIANRIYVDLNPDNTWSIGMGDAYELINGSILNPDTWYYLVITWDGTNARGYLNGSLDCGPTVYSGLTTIANIAYSASWDGSQEFFDGTLDELRVSSTARSADWIKTEYNNQNDPATFYNIGNEETPVPTAVDLISFTATGQDENVLVEWETAQEVDNLGFNLYRSSEQYGSYSKLNKRLIPGLLSSVLGQHYAYIDKDVTWGAPYYYMLEDVDLDGTKTMHGPICVDWDGDGLPDDYVEDPDDDDSDTDTGDSDPEIRIPDPGFEELKPGLTDWTPSVSSASWVKLASFRAYEQDDGVALEWETSFEIDILGFHVYREADGQFYRITTNLVPGSVFKVGVGRELPAGESYVYWDGLSKRTGQELYWLDCVELNGGRASFGPIRPEISDRPISKRLKSRFRSIAEHQVSRARELKKIRALRDELSTRSTQEIKSQGIFYSIVPVKSSEPRLPPSEEQWALSAEPAVKIYVKEDGWYRVGEPELVAAGLRSGVDPRYLQLYADGGEQSIMVTGSEDGRFDTDDVIEFYGTGLNTPFTDAHVYWLVVGSRPGRRVDTPFTDIRVGPDKRMRIPRGLRGRGGTLSFPYTVELKERTFYFAALKSGERENFFGSVISTDPVDQLLTVAHLAPSSPRGAMLEVAMQGATDVYHQVRILLNNRVNYDVGFTGQLGGRVEIPISQDYLLEGDNIVTLAAQGGSADVSLVDYIRLTYWRTYAADEDSLRLEASGGEWLSIGGFSSPGIRVVDITDPLRLLNVRGKVQSDGSDYAITVKVPMVGRRTLLAFTEEKINSPAGIEANLASSWHEINQGAEVIIIGHRDLLESVEPLKQLREQQGWSVELVDVEDLYDEFNFGAKSPWAVKDFLARAYEYWSPQPRYLIMVGDTSYDPRNYLGYGEFDLMPTKFVDTERLKTASDDWFVDFDDDGLPEMATGRLPVGTAEEGTAVVSKIISYEGVAGLMNEVLLVSDTNDFFNFEQATAKVAELLPANITISEIFRGRSSTAKSDLLGLLNQGQLLVNYFGHGSTQIWRGNLLTYSDAQNLTNAPYLPFLVSTTCLNGFFQDPYSESLAEALVKAEQGGAVAVWTSSGLTDPEDQVPLNEELIQLLFNGQELTIGEAIMGAKQAVDNQDIRRTWILFGDPMIKLP